MNQTQRSVDESIIDTYLTYPELKDYCVKHIFPFMDKHFHIEDLYNKEFQNSIFRQELFYSAKYWIRKNIVESEDEVLKGFIKLNQELSYPIPSNDIPELLLISFVIYHKIIVKDIPDIYLFTNPCSLVCLPPEVANNLYGLIEINELCLNQSAKDVV